MDLRGLGAVVWRGEKERENTLRHTQTYTEKKTTTLEPEKLLVFVVLWVWVAV